MKIVSANYRARGSDHPWLIRDAKEQPEKAVAVKSVIATGVTFGPSSDRERGFGCSMVARCRTAEKAPANHEQIGERLTFNGISFYTVEGETRVEACHQLLLMADGSMWAVLKAPKRARPRKKALAAA
ncbi:hypothetical protein KKD95_01990 [Patescibacteria group bacterium]|nr:hypothetical protein [Patescibacteria group bacterium]